MKSFRSFEENTYTGYSPTGLVTWYYSRMRTFIHRQRKYNRKDLKRRLKTTSRLENTQTGPALIIFRGASSTIVDSELIKLFSDKKAIFAVNQLNAVDRKNKVYPNYLILNDEPFWYSSDEKFVTLREQLKLSVWENLRVIQPGQYANLTKEENTIFYHGNPLTNIVSNIKLHKVMGLPNITSFYAIASAIYLGYNPVILAGLDLSFAKFLVSNESGYWLEPHHAGESDEERIELSKFRRSVPDLFGSIAFQIRSLTRFNPKILLLGHESLIDTVPKIGVQELKKFLLEDS